MRLKKEPCINNLPTTTECTAVEIKTPKVSDLVKRANYDAEIKDVKDKYFRTSDYNNITINILDSKITTKRLVDKSGLNKKIKTLATKQEIKH